MLEHIRRHTSLLIAILAIVVLTVSQVTAQEGVAEPGVDQEAVRPAGIDADTVDGRHAVGAATDIPFRAGKLVATNAQGHLPNDILVKAQNADRLDGYDSAAFARLAALKSDIGAVNQADNPVHWRQLRGVPAPIADGSDDAGVTGLKVTYREGTFLVLNGGITGNASLDCPAGSFAIGGGFIQLGFDIRVTDSFRNDVDTWIVYGRNTSGEPRSFRAVVTCLEVTPAGDLTIATEGVTTADTKTLPRTRSH